MKILVVDDQDFIAKGAKMSLAMAGYTDIDIAPSVEAALALVAENDYDCIMIEFRIPKQHMGLHLARRIRDDGFKGLMIALVTVIHTFTVERMIEMGFNACIQKPLMQDSMYLLELSPDATCFDNDDFVYERNLTPRRNRDID